MQEPFKPDANIPKERRFSDAETQEIYAEAAKIQSDTLFETSGEFDATQLEAGANRAGIEDRALEAAIQKRDAAQRLAREKAESDAKNRAILQKRAAIGSAIIGGALLLSLWSAQISLSGRATAYDTQNAQVEAVLQRRADLIPNALAYAKANLETDRALIRELENAQNGAANSDLRALLAARTQNGLSVGVLDELAGAENRIAVERRRTNLAAGEYNRIAGTFPASLWRSVLGFPARKPLFQAETKNAPRF